MNDRFTIWNFKDVPNAYVPKKLLNIKKKLALRTGVSFVDDMPNNLQFSADPDYPNDLLMLDSFGNTQSVIPISPKLKTYLESKDIPNLEFIPVDMLDHKSRVIEQYFLLHSTEVIDAIDKTQTELEVDDLNAEMYDTVENLILLDESIPADIQIFRVKGLYDVTCVSKTLAKEIDDNGFTGIEWEETSEYSY
ncbi:imm11 family protein [Paraglaciecola arctica]|uniref:Immunity MXAN-0049 protein domain-containing protein n=1 Tax=Paraglaciecola arctica BSs20135 TaxID=493475 RepID=K6Z7I9_9ALTE|nr:DUF1629 domain-containing protein [Paraglaciecola arctica]GAC19410.1 hypothetical protein GARC_2444 [Paraglaciecola arctica BSs20135]